MGNEDRELRDGNIILIGYRCTGKTTVGKRLAVRLNLPFIDTDELVEKAVGKTIREMIADRGWEYFRQQEQAAIRNLTAWGKSVIATGGGAVMDKGNAVLLKKEGILIWLVADEKTILERMRADPATAGQRPRFSPDDLTVEIRNTLAVRAPAYRRLADFALDTTIMNTEECVTGIELFLKENFDGLLSHLSEVGT
jgi:shikimate kinase